MYSHRRVSPISRVAANRGPDSRFPAESGNGGFPDSRSRPSREPEIPSPIPGQIGNRGNGNWGFPGLRQRVQARRQGSRRRRRAPRAQERARGAQRRNFRFERPFRRPHWRATADFAEENAKRRFFRGEVPNSHRTRPGQAACGRGAEIHHRGQFVLYSSVSLHLFARYPHTEARWPPRHDSLTQPASFDPWTLDWTREGLNAIRFKPMPKATNGKQHRST